jgi:hypothetical protein
MHRVHHVVELRGFVRLARGDGDGEHKTLSVSHHVEFGSSSAARGIRQTELGKLATSFFIDQAGNRLPAR